MELTKAWTREYMKETKLEYRKKYGQFFTDNLNVLQALEPEVSFFADREQNKINVLEPSFGTGNIIEYYMDHLQNRNLHNSNLHVTGVEIDKKLFEQTRVLLDSSKLTLIHKDFFEYIKHERNKFDIIVGNPPYFEIKTNTVIKERYSCIIQGRLNVYSMFLHDSIKLLKPNGHLYFVLPQTIVSGLYFEKLRRYILKYCDILDIIKFGKNNLFHKALQNVLVLKLRRLVEQEIPVKSNFVWEKANRIFFVTDANKFRDYSKTTIHSLNCRVKTGSIVWNQHKTKLESTQINRDHFPLIRSKNLIKKDNDIVLDTTHCQYIGNTTNYNKHLIKGPFLLVNRIIGKSGVHIKVFFEKYVEKLYFVENHLNVIYSMNSDREILQRIKTSLESEKTLCFVKDLLGSTQLSKEELENVIFIE